MTTTTSHVEAEARQAPQPTEECVRILGNVEEGTIQSIFLARIENEINRVSEMSRTCPSLEEQAAIKGSLEALLLTEVEVKYGPNLSVLPAWVISMRDRASEHSNFADDELEEIHYASAKAQFTELAYVLAKIIMDEFCGGRC